MTEKQQKYLRVLLWSHGIALLSVPLFLLLRYLTRSWGALSLGECCFRTVLRVYCPGCGGSRALSALVHLDISSALAYSPALFLFLAVVLWMDFWILFSIARKRETYLRFASPRILWGFVAAAFLIAMIRTILAYAVGYDPLGDLTAAFL